MTQQPFYPQAPQPQYQQPVQQAQPAYPSYPQAPQQQAPYQQPYQQPQVPAQQPPAQPLAQGTIDDYYSQPSTGGGPSLSWSNKDGSQKPIGTAYVGIVARDVTNADIQQETDFRTQQPKFYRDGRPKFVMKVPLRVPQSQEHPDGEAAWYVKGQSRDELVRAMAEAGCSGAPTGGAGVRIELVQRKPMGQGMNPANVVRVQYQPAAGQAQAPTQQQSTEAPSPASVPAAQPTAQPTAQQQAPQAVPEQPQYQPAPVQQQQQAQVQPQQTAQSPTPQPPAGLSPEQQQMLAQMTGNQAPGQA